MTGLAGLTLGADEAPGLSLTAPPLRPKGRRCDRVVQLLSKRFLHRKSWDFAWFKALRTAVTSPAAGRQGMCALVAETEPFAGVVT